MFQSISLFGKTISLYEPINIIAYLSTALLLLFHVNEYRNCCTIPVLVDEWAFQKRAKNKSYLKALALFESVLMFVLSIVFVAPLNNTLSRLFLGDTSEGYFPIIIFGPFALFALGVLFRITPLRLLDFAAPGACWLLIIFKIACFCEGCCNGIELLSSPFYNHYSDRYELPIQLIEIACAIAMFIVLSIMRKKRKRAGFMFSTFIVMYCGSRFIFEFWRDDYPDVIGRLNGNQIMSLIGLALGIVYLVIVFAWGVRITAFFDEKNKAFLEKELGKIEKKSQKKSKSKKR